MTSLGELVGDRGATIAEISSLLGIPEGTARNLIAYPKTERHAVFEACGHLPPNRRKQRVKLYRLRGRYDHPSPRSLESAAEELTPRDDTDPRWTDDQGARP